jgi:hypothetical protein
MMGPRDSHFGCTSFWGRRPVDVKGQDYAKRSLAI